MSEADLRGQTGDVDPGRDRSARATRVIPRNYQAVHRRAATANLPKSPITVNAVSRNDRRYLALTETWQALDYRPRDNAVDVPEVTVIRGPPYWRPLSGGHENDGSTSFSYSSSIACWSSPICMV